MNSLKNLIREYFNDVGLSLIEIYGDRQLSYTNKDVGFYTYVFGKRSDATF